MLCGSVIVVTGGLGRLGRAIVEQVESLGGTAVATTRDAERAVAYNNTSTSMGRRSRALTFAMDVPAAVDELVNAVVLQHGQLTGLVNNAFLAEAYRTPGADNWAVWPEAARVGLATPEALTAAVIEARSRTHVSAVVNVASIYGLLAPDPALYTSAERRSPSFYGAIKAALLQMTRYHAVHWASTGVRINAVTPGGIFDDQEPGFLERYSARVPIKRMVTREEVARVICFLLSNESTGIVGQNIVVDGGRTVM